MQVEGVNPLCQKVSLLWVEKIKNSYVKKERPLLSGFSFLNTNLRNVSSRTNTIGYINAYGDKSHAVGIKASTVEGTTNPVVIYDGNELHVPRALEDNGNGVYRVRDISAVLSGTTWYLRVRFIHPTGVQTRYIPLQSSIT